MERMTKGTAWMPERPGAVEREPWFIPGIPTIPAPLATERAASFPDRSLSVGIGQVHYGARAMRIRNSVCGGLPGVKGRFREKPAPALGFRGILN